MIQVGYRTATVELEHSDTGQLPSVREQYRVQDLLEATAQALDAAQAYDLAERVRSIQ